VDISSPQNSPRFLLPRAVINAISALIEDVPDVPDYRRAALREIRAALCRLYKQPVPEEAANASDVAQYLSKEVDDEETPDTI